MIIVFKTFKTQDQSISLIDKYNENLLSVFYYYENFYDFYLCFTDIFHCILVQYQTFF